MNEEGERLMPASEPFIPQGIGQSQDVFRLLVEALPQLVWISDPEGHLEYANRRWYEYLGCTVEESAGSKWITFYHPDDREKVTAVRHASFLTSQPFEVEARMREGKTGAYRWFLIRAVPLKDARDRVRKWFGTNTDIHEHRRLEEMLREREVRFNRLMKSNIIGIIINTLEGTIREANDAFLSLLGYTRADLLMGRLQWTRLTPPEYHTREIEVIEEEMATGKFMPFEKELLAKDGRRVPVLIGGTSLRERGTEQMYICFVLDLTSCKEKERQTVHQSVSSYKEIRHELKTPLAALRGTLQLAQRQMRKTLSSDEPLSPQMDKFLANLKQNLESAINQADVQTGLINELLKDS